MEEDGGIFKATRWTTVQLAGQPEAPGAEDALAKLCEDYRPPLLQFARGWLSRRGFSPEDAEDLTQGFFCHFIESNLPGKAGKERGRFRTFLCSCLTNYLRDEFRRRRRARVIPAGLISSLETAAEDDTGPVVLPEEASKLDALWAESIRRRVVTKMENDYGLRGKAPLFARLRCLLDGRKPDQSFSELAQELGLDKPAIHLEVLRLRERFRKRFREEVGQIVTDATQVEEELRHLLQSLSAGQPP